MSVRIGELRGLTSLPIHRVREQFRYEEVLTVLPVRDAGTGRETLFVATRPTLALLTAVRVPPGHWTTRWARWEKSQAPGRVAAKRVTARCHHLDGNWPSCSSANMGSSTWFQWRMHSCRVKAGAAWRR